ncbi:ead/Ea22-like family protein, partial [Escherichia coli]|uniref:ead/Ea22-like family protein n=1 Tax=Escherichia coli TaxID=562 RepID=UPI003EE256BB
QQYIKRRDQENEDIALTVGRLRVELEAAKKRIAELEAEPVSHIKPDEQNLNECYPVNNRIFREGDHQLTSCGGSGRGIQY